MKFSWGHMKTECMLILIWVMFDSALTVKIILGMLLTVMAFLLLPPLVLNCVWSNHIEG
ncbi:hypothetical protein DAI22_07g044450 [Oryza sativa Japonica Group]|uniref:Uncharacterized protein n=1 Tax=Oryza sativa subsp. japonica TaxID=39947 RepID=Q7XID5_ORYSJ|nr:hypothetical protein DAI22_07g044450 [Oryza sativa Japonica Group]BAC79750.1 hypothetical protein [Oryza sativa Japonica Group]BAD30360.1 hypothetical protein [Oryza sativa Japonica Group]